MAGIFRPYLQLLAAEFSGRICSYLPEFSGLTFSGTRRPEFPGRICCFWPGFSGRSFSGMGNFKKNSMGSRQIVLVSTAGISVLNAGIFWRESKTKKLFSQCSLCGVVMSRCSTGLCSIDTFVYVQHMPLCKVQLRPLWCRHVQVQHRPL